MGYLRHHIGKIGEDLARQYYERAGYRILARNWRCQFGELDLVCSKGATLTIVEVKTRRSVYFGPPEEAVGAAKIERMKACCRSFMETYPIESPVDAFEFQVCAVMMHARGTDIQLFTIGT